MSTKVSKYALNNHLEGRPVDPAAELRHNDNVLDRLLSSYHRPYEPSVHGKSGTEAVPGAAGVGGLDGGRGKSKGPPRARNDGTLAATKNTRRERQARRSKTVKRNV